MGLSTNAKVGIVFFLAAIALATIIVWKGDIFLRVQGYELIGSFEDVGGLIEGAEVRYRGYKVGKVTRVIPGIKDTKVHIQVASHVKIPKGSTLRVAFDGIIGQKFIEVVPIESKEILKPGDTLHGYKTLGLVDFIDVGTADLREMQKILQSIRKITDDPQILKAAKGTIINAESVTKQLNILAEEMNKVVARGEFTELLESLRRSSDLIAKMSETLDSTAKSLETLTADPEFQKDLREAVKGAKEAMEEFKEAARDVRKTMKKLVK